MLNPNYNYLIIDTETTGLSTVDDDIIQIGLIRIDHEWNITDRFTHYVKPEHFSIDQLKPLIQHITGIDTAQIMSAPPLSQLWPQIEQYTDENTVIIGHNIAFDIAMMSKHRALHYADTIDTYDVTRTLLHYQRSYSLEIIHQQLLLQPRYRSYLEGVQIQAHDALSDCYMTYAILRYAADRIQDMTEEYIGLQNILPYGQRSHYLSSGGGTTKEPTETNKIKTITWKDLGFEPYSELKPYPDRVKGVIFDEEGNVVLMRVPKADHGDLMFYDLPGGKIETNEDMIDALRREVTEETGYQIKDITPLGEIDLHLSEKIHTKIYGYLGYCVGNKTEINLTDGEKSLGYHCVSLTLKEAISNIQQYISNVNIEGIKRPYYGANAYLELLKLAKQKMDSSLHSEGLAHSQSRSLVVSLPTLKFPVASPKTMVDHEFYDWTGLASTSKIGLEHAGFHASLLKLVHPQRKMIIAFAHRAKLDLAKRILADHGITGVGYLRANQYIDPAQLISLGQQGSRTPEEVSRILKYCSHHHQGLSVLDHNMPGDFIVYQRMRLHRDDADADIILSSHAGVYAALQDNTHTDHAILFWDHQWWLSSAQRFYQSGVRIDHLLSMMQGLVYKLKHTDNNSKLTQLDEIESRWEVLWGVFGSELTKIQSQLPTNNKGNIELIGGLPRDLMHQFAALYERRGDYLIKLSNLLDTHDDARLSKTINRLDILLQDGCQIEIQISYQGDNLIISPASTYVDYADFRALFAGRHVIFTQTTGQGTDNITTAILPHPPTIHLSHIRDLNYQSGQKLFIIQSNRNQCKATFDTLMKSGLNKQTLLMGENVTGGGNKLIEQAKGSPAYVMVGGYDLYMQTLASQVGFDAVIVIGSLGVLHEQMVRDIEFFAS